MPRQNEKQTIHLEQNLLTENPIKIMTVINYSNREQELQRYTLKLVCLASYSLFFSYCLTSSETYADN